MRKDPNATKEYMRNYDLVRLYGITAAQYDATLKEQNGVCAICGRLPKTKRLAVDHNHRSHKVRGLLCFTCNRYRVSGNTVESAQRVVDYLRKYDNTSL